VHFLRLVYLGFFSFLSGQDNFVMQEEEEEEEEDEEDDNEETIIQKNLNKTAKVGIKEEVMLISDKSQDNIDDEEMQQQDDVSPKLNRQVLHLVDNINKELKKGDDFSLEDDNSADNSIITSDSQSSHESDEDSEHAEILSSLNFSGLQSSSEDTDSDDMDDSDENSHVEMIDLFSSDTDSDTDNNVIFTNNQPAENKENVNPLET
jgi:hypothetical protein